MSEKLVRLFARMLYDIGRGYGSPQVKDFISYILSLNLDDKKKEEIVKKALQIAIAGKTANDPNLAEKLVEEAFKNENIDKNKVKQFVRVLIDHRGIKDTRLRGVYLQALI